MFFVKVGDEEKRICFKHSKTEKHLVNKYGKKEKVKHPYETKCFITDGKNKDKVLGVGITICSKNDQFEYNVGRKIALKRALREANFSKKEREEVWKRYLD